MQFVDETLNEHSYEPNQPLSQHDAFREISLDLLPTDEEFGDWHHAAEILKWVDAWQLLDGASDEYKAFIATFRRKVEAARAYEMVFGKDSLFKSHMPAAIRSRQWQKRCKEIAEARRVRESQEACYEPAAPGSAL